MMFNTYSEVNSDTDEGTICLSDVLSPLYIPPSENALRHVMKVGYSISVVDKITKRFPPEIQDHLNSDNGEQVTKSL